MDPAVRHRREQGYILMYVLAVMMVLGGVALSVAYRQRIGVQLVHNVVDMAQEEWALNAALTYTKAQLDITAQLAAAANTKDPYAEMVDRWQVGNKREIQVGDQLVRVQLRPAMLAPDFNQFTQEEVTRLFVAIGVPVENAARFAQMIIAARPASGFASKNDLARIPGIPVELLGQPDESVATASTSTKDKAKGGHDLYHLVDLGSKVKQIDLDATPLPIIAALTGLTMEQLVPLTALRAAGPVDRGTVAQKISPAIVSLAAAGNAVLAHLEIAGGHAWGEALLSNGKSGYTNDPISIRYGDPNKMNHPDSVPGAEDA